MMGDDPELVSPAFSFASVEIVGVHVDFTLKKETNNLLST